jgi:hypothetical protein
LTSAGPLYQTPSGTRWAGLCGAGFVVLFAIAAALYGAGAGADQGDITAYYADFGSRVHQLGGFAVLLLATALLLVYVVYSTFQTVQDAPLRLTAMLSGAIGTVFVMLANALWAATAFTVQIQSSYTVAASSHLLMEDAAFVCLITGMVIAIPWVLITALSGRRSGDLPTWFAALAVLSAMGQALSYWYFPLAAFLAWVLAGSVLLTRRRTATAPTRR